MMAPMGAPADSYGAAPYGHPGMPAFPGPMAGGYPAPGGYGYPYYPQPVGPGPPIQKTKHSQGPPGCNLFIFHIPNDMTNRDLFNFFAPFGNVISARIMVDRDTGRSRGFGFVSYDNPDDAAKAIANMDGAQVGKKRLKVAHKKEKGTYDHSRDRRDRREGPGGAAAAASGAPGAHSDAAAAGADPAEDVVARMGNLAVSDGAASGGAAPAADSGAAAGDAAAAAGDVAPAAAAADAGAAAGDEGAPVSATE